jgi:hypothetical protein
MTDSTTCGRPLSCLPYDVFDADLGERCSTGRPGFSLPLKRTVNHSADFYLYTGEPCKSGYQLGSGNCRKSDGRMVAVPTEQCAAMAGTIELPFEGGDRSTGLNPPNQSDPAANRPVVLVICRRCASSTRSGPFWRWLQRGAGRLGGGPEEKARPWALAGTPRGRGSAASYRSRLTPPDRSSP